MKVQQRHFIHGAWQVVKTDDGFDPGRCQLVLAFGSVAVITETDHYAYLKTQYPNADIVIASTAGEILDDMVYDNSLVVTAMTLEKTAVKSAVLSLNSNRSSYATGYELMQRLTADDLSYVFVISDGTKINGSELVSGFNADNPRRIPVTGGLAGDGSRFQATFTALNDVPTEGNVIAIGFYGNAIRIGHGSVGGWDEFGHERVVTKSDKNVLYEIDNKSALSLYKEYLGDYVAELPGSALLFPLSLKKTNAETPVVRTILAISEADNSMTFAGNMPEGSKVRLMKANFDKLIDASSSAADVSFEGLSGHKPELAILISCVGRKLILQHRIDEEVEAARDIFGGDVPITGFYSYGEISPFTAAAKCELHNQTMTITTFYEL